MAIGEKGQSTLWLNPSILPILGSMGIQLGTCKLGCMLLFVLLLRLDLDRHSNLHIMQNTAYYSMVMLSRGVIWPMTTTVLACLGIVLNHSNTQ
jgi:hypothetical protein